MNTMTLKQASMLKEMGENCNIQRYKGLGEMNPEQLWETTMHPAFRTLKRVSIADAMEADQVFEKFILNFQECLCK